MSHLSAVLGLGKGSLLQYLGGGGGGGPVFEPLTSKPLYVVTMKVAFLLALATTKRVGELQDISEHVALHGRGLSISWLPEFVAKTESERNPSPHSFLVRSLLDLVGDLLEECVLRPVCAVCIYLELTKDLSPRPRSPFVSPRHLRCSILKNALSFFICRVIVDAGASMESSLPPRAHSVCVVTASAVFLQNWSISKVLEATTWRSNPVFASFFILET